MPEQDYRKLINELREDAAGWKAESKKYTGRTHFSYSGVALMLNKGADAIEALLADETVAEYRVLNQSWVTFKGPTAEADSQRYADLVRAEYPLDPYRGRIQRRELRTSEWTTVTDSTT